MFVQVESTLDDLMRASVEECLSSGLPISPSRGTAKELVGATLELTNPLARLSRSETRGRLFSSIGELVWYLSGSDALNQIAFYIPKYIDEAQDGRLRGAYGPRLFPASGYSPVQELVKSLALGPDSRRAVLQLFDVRDLEEGIKDPPCTCVLQFLVRSGKIHLIAFMRSNDLYLGMPHDVFCFTMLQELVAKSLDVALGTYQHHVGSLHLYDRNADSARAFLSEGWQSTRVFMPPMPSGDPWNNVEGLVRSERILREGGQLGSVTMPDHPYWRDLVRLLALFAARKREDVEEASAIADALEHDVYRVFLRDRR